MEFIGDPEKRYFSRVVGAETGFECVDDCPWKREGVKTVPADNCFEKEQRNVAIAGGRCGSQGLIVFKDGKYYSMFAW